ncbi:MAG: tetratricopeptide repeat protein [Candidatus Krumholzibacteria bacterium]|nr:tetratricopeptide repeat protein [Candidatus Krumholzibacteria bacterium]
MLNTLRIRVTGIAIAAVLIISAFVTGCGEDNTNRTTRRRVARTTRPALTNQPPVSSVPKAVPVEDPAAAKPEKPELPKFVAYEDAEAAYNDRQYAKAVELFTIYTGNRDENPWGFYMLGLSAWKAGDHEYAEESFEKALALAPGHVKSMLNLSRVYLDTDRPSEALVRIDEAIDIDPGSHVVYRLKGRALYQLDRKDEAIESYQKAISINEKDAWSMNNLALIMIGEGRYEEALLPLARATQIDSNRVFFWNNLGMALERTGRFRSAEAAYGAAFEADDGHDKAYANLVRVQSVDEEPGVETIDLGDYAQRFIEKMEDWKLAAAGNETDEVTALTDSLTIGLAKASLPDTSTAGPE